MWVTQSFSRAGLSLLVMGALLGACSDDGDASSDTDEQTQAPDAGPADMPAARAGRGGGGSAANNRTSAGRTGGAGQQAASAGRAGQMSNAASGGTGGSAGQAGSPQQAGSSGATAGAAGAVDPVRVSLNDAQIVAVLGAVNSGEISSGTLAVERAVSSAVRNYAESMVTVHKTAQERQSLLAMELMLTQEPSPLSMQLADDASSLMDQLSAASEAEFDALYLRSQVDNHMKVLMLIEERLLPSVTNEMLRTEIMQTRTEVAAHHEGARNATSTLDDTDAGVP